MMNGTLPNEYWLDYFNYTTSTSVSSSLSTSGGASSVIVQPSSSSGASIPSRSNSVSTTSSSSKRIGPIIGGVLGGIVLFIALVSFFLFMCLIKRRGKSKRPPSQIIHSIPGKFASSYLSCRSVFSQLFVGVTPFPAWENREISSGDQEENHSIHTQSVKPFSISIPPLSSPQITTTPQTDHPVSGPSTPGIRKSIDATCGSPTVPQTIENRTVQPADVEERKNPTSRRSVLRTLRMASRVVASSSNPVVQHHVDSGVRLRQSVVEVPPPYSER